MKKRLTGKDTALEVITLMSEGNPGAINVMMNIIKSGSLLDLLHMDDMNMRGPKIWVGFKDHCKGDVDKFIECIRSRDKAMIETINKEMPENPVVSGGASLS